MSLPGTKRKRMTESVCCPCGGCNPVARVCCCMQSNEMNRQNAVKYLDLCIDSFNNNVHLGVRYFVGNGKSQFENAKNAFFYIKSKYISDFNTLSRKHFGVLFLSIA